LEDELSPPLAGFNYYHWDGRDNDGDILANGVYLYKIILKNGDEQKEKISKLVILR
jgi:flagellar hook assembly protein FlgD